MEYTIQHMEDQKMIIATAKGEWHKGSDDAMVHEIMQAVDASESSNVLVDIRELQFDLPIVQIFERAQELRGFRGGFGRTSTKVALVYPSNSKKVVDDMTFFETAARNRGLPYRTFKDFDEAMVWLAE